LGQAPPLCVRARCQSNGQSAAIDNGIAVSGLKKKEQVLRGWLSIDAFASRSLVDERAGPLRSAAAVEIVGWLKLRLF